MRTRTITMYVCEVCGYTDSDKESVENCERNGTTHALPELNTRVVLLDGVSHLLTLPGVYRVLEHGIWPGVDGVPHTSAFKVSPACSELDSGLGRDWWPGAWKYEAEVYKKSA